MSYYDEDYEGSNSELPEFLQKISDIVDERVEELLVKKVADIDSVRKKQAEYKDIIAIKNKAISDSAEALREARQEVSRIKGNAYIEINNIKSSTVFDYINGWGDVDRAYYLEERTSYIGCPVCGGKETVEADVGGVKVQAGCPVCNPTRGSRYNSRGLPKYSEYKVYSTSLDNDIFLYVNPATKQVYPVTHIGNDSSKMLNLEKAFRTEEEAKAEAYRRKESSMLSATNSLNVILKSMGLTEYIIE